MRTVTWGTAWHFQLTASATSLTDYQQLSAATGITSFSLYKQQLLLAPGWQGEGSGGKVREKWVRQK